MRLSHQELANLIGSTRETVTLLLGELKSEQFVRLGRRQIIIERPNALAELVDRPAPRPPSPVQAFELGLARGT